jgi:hypothetical protein
MLSARSLSLAFVGLASLSMVGCEYFSQVTVPINDTNPPEAWSTVYDVVAGKHVASGVRTSQATYTVKDDRATYLAIGAAMDNGGAKRVTIQGNARVDCTNGQGIASTQYQHFGQEQAEQSGGVGSTVDNGVFTYYAVRFDQIVHCSPGFHVESASFSWVTLAEDFHGNRAVGAGGVITYAP